VTAARPLLEFTAVEVVVLRGALRSMATARGSALDQRKKACP